VDLEILIRHGPIIWGTTPFFGQGSRESMVNVHIYSQYSPNQYFTLAPNAYAVHNLYQILENANIFLDSKTLHDSCRFIREISKSINVVPRITCTSLIVFLNVLMFLNDIVN
jgi:hypothetical protein